MKNATKNIIVIAIVVCSFAGILFFRGLYAEDNGSEDSLYEIEQAMLVGVSQSYSPKIICETDKFVIKELTPEVLSVFGKEKSHTYNDYGYMEAIDNAVIVVGNNYKIESETALTSYYSQGSETRHLHIIVSPKHASRNAHADNNHSVNNS